MGPRPRGGTLINVNPRSRSRVLTHDFTRPFPDRLQTLTGTELGRTASRVLGRELPMRRTSYLSRFSDFTRLATCHARLADPRTTGRHLAAAERAFDRAHQPPARWLSFVGPAELSGMAAVAHERLGDLARAETLSLQALEVLPARYVRNAGYYRLRAAELQHRQGHHDAARHTAAPLHAAGLDPRLRLRLAKLDTVLNAS